MCRGPCSWATWSATPNPSIRLGEGGAVLPGSRSAAWARLLLTPGVGPRTAHALLRAFGSAETVLDASQASLSPIVGEELARALSEGPNAALLDHTLAWIDASGHHFLTWDDGQYPRALLQLPDPPPCLFYLGRPELLARPALAIVGSRNATAQGLENARGFAQALSQAGLTIVSGLAQGIDTAAHRGGLEGAGSSIAVLGTGIDRVYPAKNRDLAHRLAEQGGLLSEFPLGTPPTAGNFPRRNRLISGLSRGCLVIEATLNSGSLITARLALEQGREVFAVPGSIHSPFSKGPHRLLRDGAKLVETAQDVLEELGVLAARSPAEEPSPVEGVSKEHERLLAVLGHDPTTLDLLAQRSGLAVDQLAAWLLDLELSGRIQALPGGFYQRLSRL
ncbi:MAG: DNA-protecting protein DprA [Betaproteobacteria bacterium]|nr:DNA-protecting protein DprA [Betaproteobacteria bacterium]